MLVHHYQAKVLWVSLKLPGVEHSGRKLCLQPGVLLRCMTSWEQIRREQPDIQKAVSCEHVNTDMIKRAL